MGVEQFFSQLPGSLLLDSTLCIESCLFGKYVKVEVIISDSARNLFVCPMDGGQAGSLLFNRISDELCSVSIEFAQEF
jgi:hypothetical protein